MSRGFRFVGIVSSSRRRPFATVSLSNPTLSSYSPALTYYYSDADRDANVKRSINWTVNVASETILTGGSPTLQVRIYTAADNVLRATQNVTPVIGQNTGTFTGRSVNAAHYVQITLTDSYSQTFIAQSSNITTLDYEYNNLSYTASNSETYFVTDWKNPNSTTSTVRTSGTIGGSAANAFDGSSGTSWTVSGITASTWVGVVGQSSYAESTAATEMSKPVVASDASGTGVVADSTQFFITSIQWRTQLRRWSRFFLRDDVPGNEQFVTNASLPEDGTMGNINLNDYDNEPFIVERLGDSTDIPSVNGTTYMELPLGGINLPLQEWYFLGVARVVNYGIHILQFSSSSSWQSWVSDCQVKLRVQYTTRRVR